ncbi:MAG: hypothetical protein E7129_02435 [Rikenellaceae bacterium]|nr:hypothetical protein [Rikenellaceae bacterium]
MRILYIILIVIFTLSSCVVADEQVNIGNGVGDSGGKVDTSITPSCVVESHSVSRAESAGVAVRSLIDQITTKRMDSNFLRLDEDLSSTNDGLYTFTGNNEATPYATNWNKALLLEATVISSPDNTEGIHYRSVFLAPEQSYKLNIVENNNNGVIESDTTHFYHTRMVGWYPKNCTLPRKEGVPATAQFDYSGFDAVRLNETVDINGVATEVVALQFMGLDGETDLMVSNVCEGQSWHKYNADSPHRSDIHPVNSGNIYREPFGHNFTSPAYSNYFTYRHYRSAIRVTAYAEQSEHNLMMWGDIESVIIRNQPTSCKVWLPTQLGEFGEVYHWGNYKNLPIVTTPMFDNDSNHPEFSESAVYPISMEGTSLKNDIYLGYSLVEPNSDVELEIHTTSGVYNTTITAAHPVKDADGNESIVNIFEPGYIYDVRLSLQTDGSIGAILSKEGGEHYYDLSSLHEFEVDEEITDKSIVSTYKLSNCYILDPSEFKDGEGNDIYDGYCFFAMTVGNGESGILSSGAQKLYPETETIKPATAHLLWESSLGLISDIELKYGYVRFKLPDSSARGNAVIAVYDNEGEVLWSWHIWITDRPAEQSFSIGEHEITILDRNLGATAATCTGTNDALATYGLYYQWGRKDPSMGPPSYNYSPINLNTAPYYDFSSDEKTAAEVTQFAEPTLRDGVENPMYLILPTGQPLSYIFNWTHQRYDFLWGYDIATGMTTKTIYDPCPYGYRVPSSELGALFSMGSGTAGTYGYTRIINGQHFFFPYAGFKGVDVGLNSLISSWKYVGQKGDYQSSMYCNDADAVNNGGINQYMHRSRIYVSSANSWNETNVGTYTGNMHSDFANRRTAASVRCVKDEKIGSISATLTSSMKSLVADTPITLTYKAHSYGSAIEYIEILASYTDTAGVEHDKVLREVEHVGEYITNGTVSYITPSDYNDDGVIFHLVVRNEHGLIYTEEITLVENSIEAHFNRWEDTMQTDITNNTRNFVVVGEEIRYYVNVSANAEPSSVKINGVEATKGGEFAGPSVSNTIWYVTWSQATKGIYNMSVEVTSGGKSATVPMPAVTVYGLTLGTRTNNPDTSGATMYMLQNNAYTNTYMTAIDTTLSASILQNYYSLFTIEANKIKSEARGTYLTGTNGSVSFGAGTNYTIAASGNNIRITYRSGWYTYNMTQTSNISIGMSYSTTNRNWNLYPVTYDIP